jgi:hypothetical protein
MVCGDCYAHRRHGTTVVCRYGNELHAITRECENIELVDHPVRMRAEFVENCHDCGSEGADIPIRADIQQQPTRTEE